MELHSGATGAAFRLHLVDLPGYGRSQGFGALSLEQMTEIVLAAAPPQAWWLGWSLGGLVASQAALMQPQRVKGLITVASSPCFAARDEWPGIRPDVLSGFQHQLSLDFQRTVERVFWRCRRWAPRARVRMRAS